MRDGTHARRDRGRGGRFGPSPAFVTDEGLTLSDEQFDTLADETAVGLAALGVGEGDVVGLLLPSVPEHFVTYVAAAKLGALTAAVNPRLVQAERTAVLRAAHPCVIVPRPDGPTPDLARLRKFASGRLARHKLPEDVVVLNALPLTAGE